MHTSTFLLCLAAIAISSVTGTPVDDGRIVNGMEITVKQAPYIVRVIDDKSYCGGSLVAPEYVVTAAHCIDGKDMSKLIIIANVTSIFEEGIRRQVSRWAIHPEYVAAERHSDIAVLQLHKPINNIPTLPLCKQPLQEHDTIQVSGWGRIAYNKTGSFNLNTVFLPVRSKDLCAQQYERFVKKNMFCAAGLNDKSACKGDSGGPAVFKGQLCGLVAFSAECGGVGISQAFTDVFAMRAFIENFMWINWS